MKRTLITACLLAASLACHGDTVTGAPSDADVNAARAAIGALSATLQAELKSAMQDGGPPIAIEVCNTRAMPLTRQVAAEHGLEVGRVSLKHRNPANAPNGWQAKVLEAFERQHAEGADPAALSWSETVQDGSGREFRYMQPIRTAGVCLACHGAQLSPDVRQVLAEKYPDDNATGYAVGDIRGAFVVTRKLPD